MKHTWGILLTALTTLVLVSSAQAVLLVTPQGHPIGGKWQRWADHMHVASWSGPLTVTTDISICGYDGDGSLYIACALNPAFGWTGTTCLLSCSRQHGTITEIAVAPNEDQMVLFHELGHEFDGRYLLQSDRRRLTRWIAGDTGRLPGAWVEANDVRDNNGDSDYFADFYATCAQADTVNEDLRLCRLVDLRGVSSGATPPTLSTRMTRPDHFS
jgi:hypothetical protein